MSETLRTEVIIDCDPGVDDAIALMVALNSDVLSVLGITTVAGNVPLNLTEANARKICTLMGRTDVPVYAGCPRALLRPPVTGEAIHGVTGLDGADLPPPGFALSDQHGVSFLIDTLSRAQTPVVLACTGPLTNLAAVIIQRPDLLSNVAEVVIMGGGIRHGNVTPVAEFNFFADPHAAQVVCSADVPITLITLDITHQVLTTSERLTAIRDLDNPVATVAADLLTFYAGVRRAGIRGAPLHDPCVIVYLLRPDLFAGYPAGVTVETGSVLTLGQSVVNRHDLPDRRSPVNVIETVDASGVYNVILQHLEKGVRAGA
jgi:purine nucleosidase